MKAEFHNLDGDKSKLTSDIHHHYHTMSMEGVKELGESVLRKLHHMNIHSSHHSKSENEPLFHGESITSSDSPQLIHTHSHTMHEEEILQTAPHHISNINISDGNDDGNSSSSNEGKFIGGGGDDDCGDFCRPLQAKGVQDSKPIYKAVRPRSASVRWRNPRVSLSKANGVSTRQRGLVLARRLPTRPRVNKGSPGQHN
eukprot:Gb_08482 [translate_table: standard]